MIRASVILAAVLLLAATASSTFARSTHPVSLAHAIRQTHSGPRRVYFCATHTKDYAAFVECLRNV